MSTRMSTMRRRVLARFPATMTGEYRDSGSAMVLAIPFVLLLSMVSISLIGVVSSNALLTKLSQNRGKTVYTAEAGLQTALGMIRSAQREADADGKVYGDESALPCSIDGAVDGTSGSADDFDVEILYFRADPSEHAADAAWLNTNKLTFVQVSGIMSKNISGTVKTPYYALVTSSGSAEDAAGHPLAGGRTLKAVYMFNLALERSRAGGGRIMVYGLDGTNGSTAYCLRAESATAGAEIKYSTNCDRDNTTDAPLIGWTYDTDYKLRLASATPVGDVGGGLCVAGPIDVEPTTQVTYEFQYQFYQSGTSGSTLDGTIAPNPAIHEADTALPADRPPTPNPPTFVVGSPQKTYTFSSMGTPATTGQPTPTVSTSGNTVTTTVKINYNNVKYVRPKSQGTGTETTTAKSFALVKTTKVTTPSVTGTVFGGTARLVDCHTGAITNSAGDVIGTARQQAMQWAYNGNATWNNVAADYDHNAATYPYSYCLMSGVTNATPLAGTRKLTLDAACDGKTTTTLRNAANNADVTGISGIDSITGSGGQAQTSYYSFSPEPKVGPGNASQVTTKQLVNFKEFGRCADVTGQSFSNQSGKNYWYAILYPCKQDPVTVWNVDWNQRWQYLEPDEPSYAASTQIWVMQSPNANDSNTTTGTKRCLVTPDQQTGSPLRPSFSTSCNQAVANWTRYTWTGHYQTSYVLVDKFGRCLTADPLGDHAPASWSTLTVRGCDGSLEQKWNAPKDLADSGLGDYREIPADAAP